MTNNLCYQRIRKKKKKNPEQYRLALMHHPRSRVEFFSNKNKDCII